MKLAMLGAALLLVACVKVPAPKTAPVTADDCNMVYSRWLAIGAINEYGADPESKPQMEYAIKTLSDLKNQDGTADRFYNSCIHTMNTTQVACMIHANSFTELHACARMYVDKN